MVKMEDIDEEDDPQPGDALMDQVRPPDNSLFLFAQSFSNSLPIILIPYPHHIQSGCSLGQNRTELRPPQYTSSPDILWLKLYKYAWKRWKMLEKYIQ